MTAAEATILSAFALALLCFFGFLPILIRDARRPLPHPTPKPVRVREARAVTRALRHQPAPAPEPAPVHVRPELARRVAIAATAVVVFSLWSGWVSRSHSARR